MKTREQIEERIVNLEKQKTNLLNKYATLQFENEKDVISMKITQISLEINSLYWVIT